MKSKLSACLEAVLQQDYPNLEVYVLDDDSSDATLSIIEHYAAQDSRLHLIQGNQLPAGWKGKTMRLIGRRFKIPAVYAIFYWVSLLLGILACLDSAYLYPVGPGAN